MIQINERLSPKIFLVYTISISTIVILIFGTVAIILSFESEDPFSELWPMLIVIPIISILSSGISILVNGIGKQNIYIIEPGIISISTPRLLPIFSQTIFVEDIIECKGINGYPLGFHFQRKKRKYLHGLSSYYQYDLYLITLKEKYKTTFKGKIYHGPPPPDKTLGKKLLKKNPFFRRHFCIPTHVIDSYIDNGYKFHCEIT